MTGAALIAGVWRREPEPLARLLQNCRFEGFGGGAYGGEAIRDALRPHAPDPEDVRTVTGASAAAAFGMDAEGRPAALFADLHEGWVTRMWRLGATAGGEPAPAGVSVPADLDLDQRGGRLAFDVDAHPKLSRKGAARIGAAGEAWLLDPPEALVGKLARVRPLVLRALSEGGRTAALLRFEGAGGGGLAGAYAAALWEGDTSSLVVDAAGLDAALAKPWAPRLR